MTVHYLYAGGLRQQNSNYAQFPAAVPTPSQAFQPAAHLAPTDYAIGCVLDFGKLDGAFYQYLNDNTSGALLKTAGSLLQDVLTAIVPARHRLNYVYFRVETAGTTGATADIRHVLIATAPTEPTLIGSALASAVALDAVGTFLYTPGTPFNGTTNTGIEIRFNEIPTGGLGDLRVFLSAHVTRFTAGNPT